MKWNRAWLNYQSRPNESCNFKNIIYFVNEDSILKNAILELKKAVKEISGKEIEAVKFSQNAEIINSIVIEYSSKDSNSCENSYKINTDKTNLYIKGYDSCGILYGVFHLIRLMQCGNTLKEISISEAPACKLRMLNHWDNMDGSIERGYAGKSIFFEKNKILYKNKRIIDYCRMLASIGINGIVINNTNVDFDAADLITEKHMNSLRKLNSVFKGYGIKLFLSINFASPVMLKALDTADPLDRIVIKWWEKVVSDLYSNIPDFGGFMVKADSEYQPGPETYMRTHDQGANMLAKLIKPYGGILIWRAFVYNCQQDWRDLRTDRAKAAYEHFKPIDGKFEDNVILQIKNGPMDFQVREPVSPLLGDLPKTNIAMELQITQEYTGQQKHVCCLLHMWKEILDFSIDDSLDYSKISDLVSGKIYKYSYFGMIGVSNVGNNPNWFGHDLAGVNLYGFGRLCWKPELDINQLIKEWIYMTFINGEKVEKAVLTILNMSWNAYEKYTSPLGIGWMVEPHTHYGPNVDGYEYSKWGTYHKADHHAIGIDRTTTGTKYTSQYHVSNKSKYDSINTCDEKLLLFFHRIRYDHKLKSGQTLIQYIYDSHFEGVEDVIRMKDLWKGTKGFVNPNIFKQVLDLLENQKTSAIEWRDVVNSYFFRKTGIRDNLNRTIYL